MIRSAAFLSSPPYISLIQIIYSQQQVFLGVLWFTVHEYTCYGVCPLQRNVTQGLLVTIYDAGIEAKR